VGALKSEQSIGPDEGRGVQGGGCPVRVGVGLFGTEHGRSQGGFISGEILGKETRSIAADEAKLFPQGKGADGIARRTLRG